MVLSSKWFFFSVCSWFLNPLLLKNIFAFFFLVLCLCFLPVVEDSPANAGDAGDVSLIPGLGRSSGGGYDNPLQYSCLENPLDRGAWWATVHGGWKRVRHDWTTEHLYIICGSWLDALIWNLQIWRAHCTMWFYKVYLSICGFWYSLRSWN